MDSSIVVAIITSAITLIGTIITVIASNSTTRTSIKAELDKHEAIQDERISTLTEEVRKHNGFAERIPKLEARMESAEKRLDKVEGRLS